MLWTLAILLVIVVSWLAYNIIRVSRIADQLLAATQQLAAVADQLVLADQGVAARLAEIQQVFARDQEQSAGGGKALKKPVATVGRNKRPRKQDARRGDDTMDIIERALRDGTERLREAYPDITFPEKDAS